MAKPGDLDGVLDEAPVADAPVNDAPQPEADAPSLQEAQPEGDDKPKRTEARPDGYVTKEERDRIARERDEIRAENRVLADRTQKLIDRFFAERDQAPKADDDPKPDYNQDPLGYIAWKDRQETREAETRAAQQKQWEQQAEEARQFEDTLSRARARFQRVAAERPEVNDLYQAVQSKVADIYAANGVPAHQIPGLVQRYEADVIRWARQEYIPIEEALEQAAAKFGIAAPAKADPKSTPDRDPATGQFVSEAEKAAKQRESQERNASLSSAPGSPVKKMTAKELAQMPEEEMWRHFESVGRKPGAKQFERDMGYR